MDRDPILRLTKNLPPLSPHEIPQDHQIWEGNQGGAHFKITRNRLPPHADFEFYTLSVSGVENDRNQLVSDFISALGEPFAQFPLPENPAIIIVSWNARDVDVKRTLNNR